MITLALITILVTTLITMLVICLRPRVKWHNNKIYLGKHCVGTVTDAINESGRKYRALSYLIETQDRICHTEDEARIYLENTVREWYRRCR